MTKKSNKMLDEFLDVLLGLVLLGVGAGFVVEAQSNTDLSNITGMVILLSLIPIAMGFGLIIKAVKSFKS